MSKKIKINREWKFDAFHTCRQQGWNHPAGARWWFWFAVRILISLMPISSISFYEQFNVPTSLVRALLEFIVGAAVNGARFRNSLKLCHNEKHFTEFICKLCVLRCAALCVCMFVVPFCNLNDVWQKQRREFIKPARGIYLPARILLPVVVTLFVCSRAPLPSSTRHPVCVAFVFLIE